MKRRRVEHQLAWQVEQEESHRTKVLLLPCLVLRNPMLSSKNGSCSSYLGVDSKQVWPFLFLLLITLIIAKKYARLVRICGTLRVVQVRWLWVLER